MPPIILYFLATGALFTASGDAFGTGAIGALVLLPTSAWMSILALNADDRSQMAVISTSLGSYIKSRVAMVFATMLVCALLGVPAIAIAIARDPQLNDWGVLNVGIMLLAVDIITVISGVVLGQLCASPIVRRPGFSWVAIALALVTMAILPGSPFAAMVALLSNPHSNPLWSQVSAVLFETLACAMILFTVGMWASWRRTD